MQIPPARRAVCPPWCTAQHDELTGEEALVHTGPPVRVTAGVSARLVGASAEEAAYVLIGDEERSVGEARALGDALIDLAEAAGPDRRGARRTPPGGPSPAAS